MEKRHVKTIKISKYFESPSQSLMCHVQYDHRHKGAINGQSQCFSCFYYAHDHCSLGRRRRRINITSNLILSFLRLSFLYFECFAANRRNEAMKSWKNNLQTGETTTRRGRKGNVGIMKLKNCVDESVGWWDFEDQFHRCEKCQVFSVLSLK